MIAEIQARQPDRDRIAEATAAHLAKGGQITKLSHVERAPDKVLAYNNRVDRKHKGRREFEAEERKIAEHARGLADIGVTANEAMRQMRLRWEGKAVITAPRLEQIAAKYGFVFAGDNRGRT